MEQEVLSVVRNKQMIVKREEKLWLALLREVTCGLVSLSTSMAGMWLFFFSSRRRHTRFDCDWSSDVCSSDLRDGWCVPVLWGAGAPLLRPAARSGPSCARRRTGGVARWGPRRRHGLDRVPGRGGDRESVV